MDTQMPAMNSRRRPQGMNSPRRRRRRQGQDQERGGFMLVLTGPRAGTMQPLPPSASSFANVYDLSQRDALFAAVMDDDDDDDEEEEHLLDSRSSKRARVVAAASEAMLQEVAASDASQSECAICLQDFGADDGEKLGAMPCSHAFHHHCIAEWLRRKAVCPLCRQRLPTALELAGC